MNTFGYLNAENYPYLQFYLMITVVYVIAGIAWIARMRQFKDYLVLVHYFISAVFFITFLECAFMYIEFDLYNSNGTRSKIFLFINITLSACRNTLARVLTLMVALGLGITVQNISKYYVQIAVLSFAYWVSNALYMAVYYFN